MWQADSVRIWEQRKTLDPSIVQGPNTLLKILRLLSSLINTLNNPHGWKCVRVCVFVCVRERERERAYDTVQEAEREKKSANN